MWIDAGIIIIFVLGVSMGFKRGLLTETLKLLSWVAALGVGYFFWQDLNGILNKYIGSGEVQTASGALSFIILAVITKVILDIAANLFKIFNRVPLLGGINRLLGGAAGFIKVIIILWVIGLLSMPVSNYLNTDANQNLIQQGGNQAAAKVASMYSESKLAKPCLFDHNPLFEIFNQTSMSDPARITGQEQITD